MMFSETTNEEKNLYRLWCLKFYYKQEDICLQYNLLTRIFFSLTEVLNFYHFENLLPMIIKILINLLIVLSSNKSINRKRTFDEIQNPFSLKLQNSDLMEGQPLDLSTKRDKIEENISTGARNTSGETIGNLRAEDMGKQLIGPFKKLLINMLNVLESIFLIYEQRQIDVKKYIELEFRKFKVQIDRFVKYFQISERIIIYLNINNDLALASYLSFCNQKSIRDDFYIKQSCDKLVGELKITNIKDLYYILLFSVKESGINAPQGVITCALLISSVHKTVSITQYRDFLIYLIVAHKKIVLEESQTNFNSKTTNIQEIKCNIYRKMFEILFPESNYAKYDEILHFAENICKKKIWFNELSVILLMQYINKMHMNELVYIFRSFNDYKATDDKEMNHFVVEYYLYMCNLFQFETLLVNKAKLDRCAF